MRRQREPYPQETTISKSSRRARRGARRFGDRELESSAPDRAPRRGDKTHRVTRIHRSSSRVTRSPDSQVSNTTDRGDGDRDEGSSRGGSTAAATEDESRRD